MKKKLLTIIILFLGISKVCAVAVPSPDYIHGMNEAFKDENFYACVSQRYNGHSDQYLTDEQLASIDSLYCYNKEITSTKGLEKLTSLTSLTLDNNQLTNIDVSKNTALTNLSLNNNQLTNINLSKNTALTRLELFNNQLTNIDVSNNTALQSLNLEKNQLTSIDISKNTSLTYLTLSNNQLTSIDVSKNTALEYLNLRTNQLTSIDVSNNNSLKTLELYYNQLTSVDVSNNAELEYLQVDEDVEVIGKREDIEIFYVPAYMFSSSTLEFNETMFKPGTYEYTVTVGNSTDKLAVGIDAEAKGYHPSCPDNVLCGGYYLWILLSDSLEGGEATINNQNINVNILNDYFREVGSLYEEQCNNDEYPCKVYKDDELVALAESENNIVIYKDGEEFYKIIDGKEKFYMYLSDLEVGTNVLHIVIQGEEVMDYTINIIRSEKEIENSNHNEEFNEIIEEIVNNKVEAPVEDKANEVLSIVPNTGILLSVSLSVVAVILIGLMYYKYYNKKKVS